MVDEKEKEREEKKTIKYNTNILKRRRVLPWIDDDIP